jgi:alpha-ribazole phosphatase
MRSYKIYLYRHGLTKGNLEGKYIGSTDLPLCEEGKKELENLSKKKEYPAVGKVYVSPLIRCAQTAEILYPGVETFPVEQIREYDFGVYENKSIDELKKDPGFVSWFQSNMAQPPQNGEDMKEFTRRIREGFDFIIKDMMNHRISSAAVITHGGVMMSILSMCGLPRMQPTNWNAQPGEGYAVLVNASLWGNTQSFEICEKLPYEQEEEFERQPFAMLDAEEIRREIRQMKGRENS